MKKIPLIKPKIPKFSQLTGNIEKMYKNSIFSNGGPFEKKFEHNIQKYLKKDVSALVVSNATVGLLLAIKAIAKQDKKYILLPSFTFAATIEAIIYAGYTPVFIDVDPQNWSMVFDDDVNNFIKDKGVAAILFCNPFGIEGNIGLWEEVSLKYSVPLICDSAAGFGSSYVDGTKMGTKGDIEVLSFHATKAFAIGEGGLIVTKHKNVAKKIESLRNFGFNKNHVVSEIGFNAKMGELYSIVGLEALKNFNKILRKKHKLLHQYMFAMGSNVFFHPNISRSALQFLPILCRTSQVRKKVETELLKEGIITRRYYYPALHKHPAFQNTISIGSLSGTDFLSNRMLALPIYYDLSEEDVTFISNIINKHI